MLCEDHYSFAWAFLKVFFSYWVSRLKYFASTVWRFQQSWCQCLTTLIVLFQSLRPEQELFWVQEQMTYSYLFLFISLTVCEIHIKSFWDSVRVLGFLLWQGFFFFEKIVSWEHWERLERLQNTLKSSFLLFAKLCWGFFCLGFQLFMSANPLVNNESTSWEENTLSYKTPPERNCLYLTT